MRETENNSTKIDRIEKILGYVKTNQIPVACLAGLTFGYIGGRLISLMVGESWRVAMLAGISGGLYIAIISPAIVIHTLEVKLSELRTGKSAWKDRYSLSPSMRNVLKSMLFGLGIMVIVFICLAAIFDYQWFIRNMPWHS